MKKFRWVLIAPCWCCVLGLVLWLGAPTVVQAQFRGVRFEITQVGDTTFRFPSGTMSWVKAGQAGIAVDPRRRDVLVARFRVIRVDTGLVTALITGQTTRVETEHIAVLTEPGRSWFRMPLFWGGTILGFALVAIVGRM